ncbi:MAG: hypothetical protein KF901_09640 [Myxococcales bacterium]|nr:hypothetical protein [Myxococcales bacterium]
MNEENTARGQRATGPCGRRTTLRRALSVVMVTFAAVLPAAGHAQGAQERQAAAEAFDRGTSAYLGEDFTGAARWFEMANNLAPAAPALLQAIRSHQRAGNELRAGTLALRLVARFPEAGAAVDEAQSVLEAVRQRYFLVEVVCPTECAVELDGTLQAHPAFFLRPNEAHTVGAGFPTGTVTEEVRGGAGEQRTLSFTAPAGTAGAQATQGADDGAGRSWVDRGRRDPEPPPPERRGVHPAAFVTSLVLTVGAGAVLVWSGLDTLSARDEYVDVAEQERAEGLGFPRATQLLESGRDKELRTNILIGATAGLAAVTLVLAIVTDWGGSRDDASTSRVRPTVGVSPHGAAIGLGGTF